MKFDIDTNQFVFVDCVGKIRFHHYSDSDLLHTFTLLPFQFYNLDDVMRGKQALSKLRWYPLGRNVWFNKKGKCTKLVDNEKQRFFRFYEFGWKEYKSNVHPLIRSFLRDVCYVSHHQSHARNESQSSNCFGRTLSSLRRRKQVLSRTTRNDCYANAKRAKSTNISRRQSSNSRSHPGRRGGKYATRVRQEIEEAKEDGELSGYEADNRELGCEPTVVIEH